MLDNISKTNYKINIKHHANKSKLLQISRIDTASDIKDYRALSQISSALPNMKPTEASTLQKTFHNDPNYNTSISFKQKFFSALSSQRGTGYLNPRFSIKNDELNQSITSASRRDLKS